MDSESSYVANANRKFRTITTMLHVFQSINKDEVPSIRDPPEAEEQGRRRKLLSALATLFVRATEVVAVASVGIKAHETAIVAVERVARAAVVEGADTSTNTDDTQTLETGAALPLQYIAVSNAVRATASPNASPEEANTNNAEPHSWCEHIHVLRGATTSSEVEIIRSLAQSKGKPPGSFSNHASTVLKLLHSGARNARSNAPHLYIIGSSYRKMRACIEHPFSCNALRLLKSVTFMKLQCQKTSEKYTERLSLKDLEFLRVLDKTRHVGGIQLPNFPRLVLNPDDALRNQTPLYTVEAAEDFHALLITLIEGYRNSLSQLNSAMGGRQSLSAIDLWSFINAVNAWGLALYHLVYSPAIAEHLAIITLQTPYYPLNADPTNESEHKPYIFASIAKFIAPKFRFAGSSPTDPPNYTTAASDPPVYTTEESTEFMDIQLMPAQTEHALRYRKWLRLVVSYFHSMAVLLAAFRKSAQQSLDLHVISMPAQDRKMLTWTELMKEYPESPPAQDMELAIAALGPKYGSYFLPTGALTTGDHTGTTHCEACIASLLYLSGAKDPRAASAYPDQLLSLFGTMDPIIGVSKRCCVVCSHLLAQLEEQKFITPLLRPSSHTLIYPCSLPEGLPNEVVDKMVLFFGRKLQKTLKEVIAAAKAQQAARKSLDSHNSEDGSSESSGPNQPTEIPYTDGLFWSELVEAERAPKLPVETGPFIPDDFFLGVFDASEVVVDDGSL